MNSPFKLAHFTLVSALLLASWGTLATAAQPAKGKPATEAKTETAAAPAAQPQAAIAGSEANPFNRLMRVAPKRHLPPDKDGIHDPANDGTQMLQTPLESFGGLPKSQGDFGNGVDWVKALDGGKINPRWDRNDPKAKPVLMDLNIVREVKGSMPGVGFPHKQHTQWLDCSNCHPAIFLPQKGANQISMAAIMLGQKCGVCHGTVAFPVAECRRCHDKAKPVAAKTEAK
ncbi:MAG: cytochrome c, class I [Gammaproteobacteria bacterium]|nr:cytochrome c, class I [Gammaproteobacteria bacterium]